MVLAKDIPDIFSGTVEVDETYLGGAWKNKRKNVRDTGTKRGRGTTKQPVFGILCRNGQVWAEIVENVDKATLLPLITKKGGNGLHYLFRHLESVYWNRIERIYSPFGESWRRDIQRWKRKSYQWNGRILGISQTQTYFRR